MRLHDYVFIFKTFKSATELAYLMGFKIGKKVRRR